MRQYVSLIIAISLVALVAAACIVRTARPGPVHHHRAQPVHVEKHKKVKHKKVKHKKHKH